MLPNASAGRVLDTGHLVFVRSGALWAVRFDLERLATVGSPVLILEGVLVNGAFGAVQYAVSDDGSTLVYVPSAGGEGRRQTLVLVDREGVSEKLDVPPDTYRRPRFSPDGRHIAVYSSISGTISVYERSRGRLTPLTEASWGPVWRPNSFAITFMDDDAIWNIPSDFSGDRQLLSTVTAGSPVRDPYSWNSAGDVLLWSGRRGDVHQLTMLDTGETRDDSLLVGVQFQVSPSFSPDGRWLSYASDETDPPNYRVYVQPHPLGSGREVLIGDGEFPIWSRSGELFYVSDGLLWATTLDTAQTLDWTDPVALFATPWKTGGNGFADFDVTSNGERLVFVEDLVEGAPRRQIKVVLDWSQELLERVPIP